MLFGPFPKRRNAAARTNLGLSQKTLSRTLSQAACRERVILINP
jgi:hypothetical protein